MSLENKIEIETVQVDGSEEKTVSIENPFFSALFAPGQAMFPLRYFYKPTGSDMLLRRETLQESFACKDGIQLCLPWVGDSIESRVPSKGLLRSADWQITPAPHGFSGETEIQYQNPLTGSPAQLAVRISVTASDDSPMLTMNTEIVNSGTAPAEFMFAAHGRMAPGGNYEDGQYVYLPSERCWLGEFRHSGLASKGLQPQQWTDWPIGGMTDFHLETAPEKMQEYVYLFVPAPWMAYGNDRSGEVIFFGSSPIRIGEKIQDAPFFCLLRRAGDLLCEMSLTRQIDVRYWEQDGATVTLEPGERAAFTWRFGAAHGLSRSDVERSDFRRGGFDGRDFV